MVITKISSGHFNLINTSRRSFDGESESSVEHWAILESLFTFETGKPGLLAIDKDAMPAFFDLMSISEKTTMSIQSRNEQARDLFLASLLNNQVLFSLGGMIRPQTSSDIKEMRGIPIHTDSSIVQDNINNWTDGWKELASLMTSLGANWLGAKQRVREVTMSRIKLQMNDRDE